MMAVLTMQIKRNNETRNHGPNMHTDRQKVGLLQPHRQSRGASRHRAAVSKRHGIPTTHSPSRACADDDRRARRTRRPVAPTTKAPAQASVHKVVGSDSAPVELGSKCRPMACLQVEYQHAKAVRPRFVVQERASVRTNSGLGDLALCKGRTLSVMTCGTAVTRTGCLLARCYASRDVIGGLVVAGRIGMDIGSGDKVLQSDADGSRGQRAYMRECSYV